MKTNHKLTDEQLREFVEKRKISQKGEIRRRLIGWPLVGIAIATSFLISVLARYGYESLTGADEDSVVPLIVGMFTLFIAGYFFSQQFRDFWDEYL